MKEELEKAWKEAVSFPGSSPPEEAVEIGRIEKGGIIFIFYRGKAGYYYNTVRGIAFAGWLEERIQEKAGHKLCQKKADAPKDASVRTSHACPPHKLDIYMVT